MSLEDRARSGTVCKALFCANRFGGRSIERKAMACSWEKVTFGKTQLRMSPIGLGSSYGVGGADLERAFERGINFFFWGLRRRSDFGQGLKRLAAKDRSKIIVAAQSYTRMASLMRPSLERVLRSLAVDHVDLLGLGWWDDLPPPRIMDAAYRLVSEGKVKHLLLSSHHRPSFAPMMQNLELGGIMVRYNAAHPGAEKEVFPYVASDGPGVLSFTATRWGSLLDAKLVPEGETVPRASDCYRFVLSNPSVHATLAGPANGAELDEAMAALDRGPLSEEEMAWMRRVGEKVRSDTKAHRILGLFDRMRAALYPTAADRMLPPSTATAPAKTAAHHAEPRA
jgi:aryl-alcohol dehydrogenase-like predicted oxidoreductase